VFERVVAACNDAGLVGGTGFAVDASLIAADANCRSMPGEEWSRDIDPAKGTHNCGAGRAWADVIAEVVRVDGLSWG
jgi:hypothetical protein